MVMRRIPLHLLLAALFVVAGCASTPKIHLVTPRPSLDADELRGGWIGYDQNCVSFYRLVLEGNNRGSCIVLYEKEFLSAYEIEKWKVTGRNLSLRIVPRTEGAEKINMAVQFVDESEMRIFVTGQERSWKHRLLMHREDQTLEKIRTCVEMQKSVFKRE